MIDSSGSINDRDPGNWDRVKSFAKNVVNRLKIGPNDAQIGIVKYSTKAYVEFPLDGFDNSNDLNIAIDNMRYLGGNTNTSGGLWLMREQVCFLVCYIGNIHGSLRVLDVHFGSSLASNKY